MIIITTLGGLAAWVNAHALWSDLPVWSYALLALADTHVTTACVTLYLHRAQTHRSISFHPVIAHLMRFWLWARTAMPTRVNRRNAASPARSVTRCNTLRRRRRPPPS